MSDIERENISDWDKQRGPSIGESTTVSVDFELFPQKSNKVDLFQQYNYISHAGNPLTWKIEADAINPAEWKCLVEMILEIENRPFRAATGIPRGGVALGVELNKHATGAPNDPLLIVDDVWTTGTSFTEITEHPDMKDWIGDGEWFGWVIFARIPPTFPVRALFEMAVPDSYYTDCVG